MHSTENKRIWITAIIAAGLAVGILLNNAALAGSNGDDNGGAGTGLRTLTYTITNADNTNDVVIGPASGKIFVMIFKTSADYDGFAKFEAKLENGDWIQIGPATTPGFTSVGSMDSIGTADFVLPLTVRLEVINQASTGSAFAQLDVLGNTGANEDDDDDEDDENDEDDD